MDASGSPAEAPPSDASPRPPAGGAAAAATDTGGQPSSLLERALARVAQAEKDALAAFAASHPDSHRTPSEDDAAAAPPEAEATSEAGEAVVAEEEAVGEGELGGGVARPITGEVLSVRGLTPISPRQLQSSAVSPASLSLSARAHALSLSLSHCLSTYLSPSVFFFAPPSLCLVMCPEMTSRQIEERAWDSSD